MTNQTRANEGRGLVETAFDIGCVATPENTVTPPAVQAPDRKRRYEAAIQTLLILRQRFPAAFARLSARKRRPLKIGIRDDIIAAVPEIDAAEIGRAVRLYTGGRVEHCVAGAQRIGLGGEPAGIVTADEARWPPEGPPSPAPFRPSRRPRPP